eukprot:RCo030266
MSDAEGDVEEELHGDRLPEGLSAAQQELLLKRSCEYHARVPTHNRVVFDRASKAKQPAGDQRQLGSHLVFSSEFECGNLQRATQIFAQEYDLDLSADCSEGVEPELSRVLPHGSPCQWYYFSVVNVTAGWYTFNLHGFYKPASLYNTGLRPYMYSKKAKCWKAVGENVCYFKHRTRKRKQMDVYVLSFRVQLQDPRDVVFFSYCFPFTYGDLLFYLRTLEEASAKQHFYVLKRKTLCETVQKRKCEVLTLKRSLTAAQKEQRRQRKQPRKYIVFTCRVHPGETNSSWIMKGILDFLTSNKATSRQILSTHSVICIPMLNPDGVALGHYRCDSNGFDLNRVWKNPHPELHPTVYHAKQLLLKLQAKGQISYFFDLHGHSRKEKLFAYGCSGAKGFHSPCSHRFPHEEKVLPLIMSKLYREFSFPASRFAVSRRKEGTARVVCWAELGIPLAYTLEASFGGSAEPEAEGGEDAAA